MNRLGRRLLWPRPWLYAPFGVLRGHGNVFSREHQVYISGFPRSGNTFARTAFGIANPHVRILSHRHIPTYALASMRRGLPGMVLIRRPLDAACSWSLFMGLPLAESLAYYNDFYRVLAAHRDALWFVRFEQVTEDFGAVIRAMNERWGTGFNLFEHTPQAAAQCLARIEAEYTGPDGAVAENRVPRPSAARENLKPALIRELNLSPRAREEWAEAEHWHRVFTQSTRQPTSRPLPSLLSPKLQNS
ncbi:MAG: hypothetical protein U1F98_02490 [Verrucomicrobiota bacterium]